MCRSLGQPRSTQRREPKVPDDEPRLVEEMVAWATQYGRYGYRRITVLLRRAGWKVNHKRVERLWRREGLKVPKRQPKRRRLWLNDGSCVRLRAERPNHVWSYDFVMDRTHDGRPLKMLTLVLPRARRVHARVPGDRRREGHQVGRRDRSTDRSVRGAGDTGLHPVGQRAGVHRGGTERVGARARGGHALHRAREPPPREARSSRRTGTSNRSMAGCATRC